MKIKYYFNKLLNKNEIHRQKKSNVKKRHFFNEKNYVTKSHLFIFSNFRQANGAKFDSIIKFKQKHIFSVIETLKNEIMFIFL